jgi:hypothetical protein
MLAGIKAIAILINKEPQTLSRITVSLSLNQCKMRMGTLTLQITTTGTAALS